MIKDHKLEGPDHLDNVDSYEQDRRSLTNLYPSVPKDTRPLIMSNEERHKQQDEVLLKEVRQIRHHPLSIALRAILWPLLFGILNYWYVDTSVAIADAQKDFNLVLLPVLAADVILVGIWIANYISLKNQFSSYGISFVSYLFFTLGALALLSIPLWTALSFINDAILMKVVFSLSILLIGVIITKIYLTITTRKLAS